MTSHRRDDLTLNSDLGESFGLHHFGNDEALLRRIDIANLACGFHAGDPDTLERTVALAAEHGVKVGAHPGLPDLVGFGRREMKLSPEEVENLVRYQVGALTGFLAKHGLPLNHIKPHGALYGMLARDDDLALGAARVAKDYGVALYGLAGTAHQRSAEREGIAFVGELYVDLDYDREGRLIVLRQPHAADPDLAAERVRQALRTGTVRTIEGAEVELEFSSVCVHSDAAGAAEVASAVRSVLDEN